MPTPGDQKYNVWINGATGPARLLPVANGLLDLSTGELLPHSPDFFSVVSVPTAFDPAATCPRWDAYIREVTSGDDTKAAVLQEMAGLCLDALSPIKWFGMLTGGGDNGKSVYLNAVKEVLGESNVSAVPLDKIGERFGTQPMFGKLANFVGDQSYFDSKDEGGLKMATGGDPIEFERKGHDVLTARNTAKTIVNANSPPPFSDPTDAVWNRLVLVPFTRTFTDAEKNPAMLNPGYFDPAGVLNWMLAGLRRVAIANAFTHSPACVAAKLEHRKASKPDFAFLTNTFVYDKKAETIAVDVVYNEYITWLGKEGYTKPLSKSKFGRDVKTVFRQVDSKSGRPDGKESVWC